MDRDSPLDQATIDNLRSMKRPGQPSLLVRIVKLYEVEAAEILDRLRVAVEQRQAEELLQMAHRFKSVSGNVGAAQLSALCKDLESDGRAGQLDEAESKLERLEAEHDRVQRALDAEVAREPAG